MEAFDDQNCSDLYKLGLACGFADDNVVGNFLDAVTLMWISSINDFKNPDNKKWLKVAVGDISKSLTDLLFYYKNSEIFNSVVYLGSFIQHEYVPVLGSFCFFFLKNELDENASEEKYECILRSLCNLQQDRELILLLKEWIEQALIQPAAPKRKNKKSQAKEVAITSKHKLGVRMLAFLMSDHLCQKILLSHSPNELNIFISLFNLLKKRVESHQLKYISDSELEFMSDLFILILTIDSLLFSEYEDRKYVEFFDAAVTWLNGSLYSLAWASNDLYSKSRKKQNRASCTFQKLSVSLCNKFCTITGDLMSLFSVDPCKYVKFSMRLLETEDGPSMIVCACKLLHGYVVDITQAACAKKDVQNSFLISDSFEKILPCLRDEDFLNAIPAHTLHELQIILISCLLKVFLNYKVFQKEMSSVMKGFVTSILYCFKKTVIENWDVIVERRESFSELKNSESSSFLTSTIFHKQKILVCFLHHLHNHWQETIKDIQSWVACYVLLFRATEIKNFSKSLRKEITCLCLRLGTIFPSICSVSSVELDMAILSLTDTPSEMTPVDVKRPMERFNIHCRLELRKLKNLLRVKI